MRLRASISTLAVCLALSATAAAEPTRIVATYPPGASLDNLARSFAEQLRPIVGDTVIVENKSGANGSIGAQTVAQAAPNGKTLLIAGDTIVTVNPVLYTKSNFDVNMLQPLAMLAFQSSVLTVPAESSITSITEFIKHAKTKETTYSSAGPGSSGHLVMANLAGLSGIKTVHIPYRGGAPAVLALLSGEVDSAFLAVGNVLPHIQQGRLRALAVSSPSRLAALPNIPTIAEAGFKDFAIRNGSVIMAPKGISADVKQQLIAQVTRARNSKPFQEAVVNLGMEPATMDAEQTSQWLSAEAEKWRALIPKLGIKVE